MSNGLRGVLLPADHDQEHLEPLPGVQGVGPVGRHNQHLAGRHRVGTAVDGDLGGAVEDADHCIERSGVLTQSLAGLERSAAAAGVAPAAGSRAASGGLEIFPDPIALLAAGGTIDLARRVARRELAHGLAAVRPPGHHAEGDRAMGFCLFNNVAVAARALQAEAGV